MSVKQAIYEMQMGIPQTTSQYSDDWDIQVNDKLKTCVTVEEFQQIQEELAEQ